MKIALITGANKGIGFEISRQLAEKGFKVLLGARNAEAGQKAARSLVEKGGDAVFVSLDVSDKQSMKAAAEYVSREFGKLDVLVNNAGLFIDRHVGMANVDEEAFEKTMDTNFYGPLWMSQYFIPLLQHSGDGRIINISSQLGAMNEMGGGYPAYRVSKAALNAMTAILSSELQGSIKVNSVCPGWVATDMGGHGAPRSVEKGAETPVWLATATDIPNGKFLKDMKVIAW